MIKPLQLFPFLLFMIFSSANAQVNQNNDVVFMPAPPANEICTIDYTGFDANFFLKADEMVAKYSQMTASSQIEVNYLTDDAGEWPQEAIEAFEYAVSIWEVYIQSDITIRVNATWRTFEQTGTLGSARPTTFAGNIGGNSEPNTWYAVAHASAIANNDFATQFELDSDIEVSMNANFPAWYFGTDANTPFNQIDFVTVVLHEIGHGIGFLGSVIETEESLTASLGLQSDNGNRFPVIYDVFTTDGDNNFLTNEAVYPSPSTALFDAITGGRGGVFFTGQSAESSNLGEPIKLYTPPNYSGGSTYSHLDQDTFTGDNSDETMVNGLMRPQIDSQLAIHSPGPILCGMLDDKGWPLGGACLELLGDESQIFVEISELDFGVTNVGNTRTLTFNIENEEGAEDILRGRVEIEGDDFSIIGGERAYSIQPGRTEEFTVRYRPTTATSHIGEVKISHSAGNEQSPIVIDLEGRALVENKIVELEQSYPNPINPNQYMLQVPYTLAVEEPVNVSIELFSSSGQKVGQVYEGIQGEGEYLESYDVSDLASGVYLYRIIANGAMETRKMTIIK